MQTDYKEMMAAARELVKRADTVAESSSAVIAMLRSQKMHLEEWGEALAGRFSAIREAIRREETDFQTTLTALSAEIDGCITLIEGRVETEKAEGETAPADLSNAPQEDGHAEE